MRRPLKFFEIKEIFAISCIKEIFWFILLLPAEKCKAPTRFSPGITNDEVKYLSSPFYKIGEMPRNHCVSGRFAFLCVQNKTDKGSWDVYGEIFHKIVLDKEATMHYNIAVVSNTAYTDN